MRKLYFLAMLICMALALTGIVNAGTGTFYDASNFGANGMGGGGIAGPGSSTDTAICRFSGTTGQIVQNSSVTIDNSGNFVLPGATSLSLSSTGSTLTLVGSTTGDASRPSIVFDDSGPSTTIRSDTYALKSANNASTFMSLSSSALVTASTITVDHPGSGSLSLRVGPQSVANGQTSVALGFQATAAQIDGIALGDQANASNQYATAVMPFSTASGFRSAAFGYSSVSAGFDSFAAGTSANAGFDNSVSVGPGSSVTGISGVSVGPSSTAAQTAFAGGASVSAAATDSVGIGRSITIGAGHTKSVCIGKNCATSAASQFQIGASGDPLDMRSYGQFQLTNGLGIWNTTPPGSQPASIANATGGVVIDVQCRAALNSLLAAARGMGMIAP